MSNEKSIHPRVRRVALAVAGGMLYAASLPPIGAWPLAWLALAPLCLGCVGTSLRGGAVVGLAFGLATAVLASPWFPEMIDDYFAAGGVAAWPLALLGWTLCGAIYHGCLGAWIAWTTRRASLSPITVGAGWWVIEYARTNALVGNPWALLAYSQIGYLPLAQLADTLGPYGLGGLLATVGAASAGLLRPAAIGQTRAHNARVISGILAVSFAYGSWCTSDLIGDTPLTAALIQGSMAKSASMPADRRLAKHLALTRAVRDESTDLVLWPELALDFYLEDEPRLQRDLVRGLRDLNVALITGGYGIDGTRTLATNSVYLLTGGGIQGRYDKNRLMSFAEANPLPFDLFLPDAMSAGDSTPMLRSGGVDYGIAICSEAMFPDHVRTLVRNGAEVILAPSVDRWFASTGGRRQQLEAVAMRAIESRRFVLRPTETGISAAIDPIGRVIADAPVDRPATFVARYAARDELTFYARFGDVGALLAFAWLVVDAARRHLLGPVALGDDTRSPDQAAARSADTR